MENVTLDRNNRSHAGAGGCEGRNGHLYQPGEYMPESDEQRAARLLREKSQRESEYRATHKPQRLRVLLAYAEEHGLPHGVAWKYSWKRSVSEAIRFGVEPDGNPSWDKHWICYVYPIDWDQYDEHVHASA